MASEMRWVWLSVLCASIATTVSCKSKVQGYGPPQPASVGGAGGGGSSGGGTNTGGSTVNFCECAFEFTYGPPECGTCVNDQNNTSTGQCAAPLTKCENE